MSKFQRFSGTGMQKVKVSKTSGNETVYVDWKDVETLRNIPLFAGLPTARLKLIAYTAEVVHFEPGEDVVQQGEPADAVYILIEGEAEVWLDLTQAGLNPDGAVIDADGRFWNAQWGAGRVACYAPDGAFLRAVETPGAPQSSCPAFGGPDLSTLYVTTALEHMDAETRAKHPASGQLFAFPDAGKGLSEPQVTL